MNKSILDTGVKQVKNVDRFNFGKGSLNELSGVLNHERLKKNSGKVLFFIDEFFRNENDILERLGSKECDSIEFIPTENEPKTDVIDSLVQRMADKGFSEPAAIVGVGGGIVLDTAKAVSNLLTNGGKAEDYQGWDLVKRPGIFKIGIPTISGTGAEATRTCVMTNTKSGLKLGMNSDLTVFNHIFLDPDLTKTVPRNQYFYTGMDAYIHCVESLGGSYRNAIGDAYSRETIDLCRKVFLSENMMSDDARENLMVASYLGGCAIAASYVGIVHPFSAGLSVVLGTHHCVGNCIVMGAMEEFYPEAYKEFRSMQEAQGVDIPQGICEGLKDEQYESLYDSTVIHEKPLTNALGENFREILTKERVIEIFQRM